MSGGSCDDGKLTLSKGMGCKLIATGGQKVVYADGTLSQETMHETADGAGVIPHLTDGGWYYCSNSERDSGNGGGKKLLLFFCMSAHALIFLLLVDLLHNSRYHPL